MVKEVSLVEQNRKRFIKKAIAVAGLALIAVVLIVLVFLAVDKYKTEKYLENYGKTALSVGAYEMDFAKYRSLYLNYRDELKRDFTTDGKTDTEALDREIRTRVMNDARYFYAIISLAADHGYTTESADIIAAAETYIAEMKTFCKDNKVNFEKTLGEGYMSEDVFAFFQRVLALEDVLKIALISDGGEIEDNDEKLLEIFLGDELIRVQSVFIENDKGEDVEKNRLIAEEVADKYKNGTEFRELIKNYSEDAYNDFYITRGEKIAVYDEAAFSLGMREVSDVVASDDGFYVIVRVEKDQKYIEENFETLKSQYQFVRYNERVEARMNSLVAVESDYLKSLSYEEIE